MASDGGGAKGKKGFGVLSKLKFMQRGAAVKAEQESRQRQEQQHGWHDSKTGGAATSSTPGHAGGSRTSGPLPSAGAAEPASAPHSTQPPGGQQQQEAPKGGAAGGKPAFSGRLMGMKFMQRGNLKRKLDDGSEQQEARAAEGQWTVRTPGGRGCVVVSEGDPLPPACLGRMSFGAFNPATDALRKQAAVAGEVDVSDKDMAAVLKAARLPGGAAPRPQDDGKVFSLRMQAKRRKMGH